MIKPSSVYFTAPSAAVAERIARKVLEERLAVCVNIIPARSVSSDYQPAIKPCIYPSPEGPGALDLG